MSKFGGIWGRALMSAALFAGPSAGVCAETGPAFDLTLKGDAFFTAGIVHQSGDTDAGRQEFMNRFRLKVTATARADNGLDYGARLRLRSSRRTAEADADQVYLFVRGGAGSVELGVLDDPNYENYVIAPGDFGTGGIDGDWSIGDVGWLQNQNTFLEPYFGGGFTPVTFINGATKINYASPRLFGGADADSGLMLLASYAPNNRSVNTGVMRTRVRTPVPGNVPYGYGTTPAFSNCGGGTDPLGCNVSQLHEVGARYDGALGPLSASASFGYLGGTTDRVLVAAPATVQDYYDLSSWQFGGQLGYGGFRIGGSWLGAGRSAYPKPSAATGPLFLADQQTWTAGLSYRIGSVVVGFNYQHGRDAGDLNVPGARTAALYGTGVRWFVAPGLITALDYLRSTTRNEPGFVSDSYGDTRVLSGDAHLLLWKTAISF